MRSHSVRSLRPEHAAFVTAFNLLQDYKPTNHASALLQALHDRDVLDGYLRHTTRYFSGVQTGARPNHPAAAYLFARAARGCRHLYYEGCPTPARTNICARCSLIRGFANAQEKWRAILTHSFLMTPRRGVWEVGAAVVRLTFLPADTIAAFDAKHDHSPAQFANAQR